MLLYIVSYSKPSLQRTLYKTEINYFKMKVSCSEELLKFSTIVSNAELLESTTKASRDYSVDTHRRSFMFALLSNLSLQSLKLIKSIFNLNIVSNSALIG